MREKRALHFGPQFDRPVGKSHRKPKKVGARKTHRNKADDPTPSEVAQCGSHIVNTMCFEGSTHRYLSDFGATLGYPAEAISRTFGFQGGTLSAAETRPEFARSKEPPQRGGTLLGEQDHPQAPSPEDPGYI